MAPTRTQPYLLGSTSNSSPNTSSRAPIASSSRSQVGHPYNRPGRNEASKDAVQDSHPAIFGPYSRVMFNGGNVILSQNTYQNQRLEGIQKLYQNSSPAAVYNSRDRYDPPKCHPNTRTGLLNMTQNWADDGSPDIMWLYGSAGAGKSAVAQTTCERLRSRSNLVASFFFSRTAPADSHRGHEGRFVTTIAYQLTDSIPDLQHYVDQVILTRPSVFDLTLPEQVVALIFDPLSQLNRDRASNDEDRPLKPRIIVVDGLDECKEETGQKQVLEAIATLVGHQDIFPFSVFIASRPELQISTWFSTADAEYPQLFRKISLLEHCDSDHDIKQFLKQETAMLQQSHPFRAKIPANWPPPPFLEEIVQRANGQFVYASIIMKYIKDLRHNPTSRLEAILRNTIPQEDQPYAELDALYFYILKRTTYPEFVRRLLGYRLATLSFYGRFNKNRVAEYLTEFLSLPCPVDTLLIDLQSIMTCDTAGLRFRRRVSGHPLSSTVRRDPISTIFHHASFVEFLQDPRRSQEFYINVRQFDQDITELALQQIGHTSDRHYVKYCFLTVLQTEASRRQTYTDRIRVQLSRWDSMHDDVTYEILNSLVEICGHDPVISPFFIIGHNLSNVFFSAVSRKREQYRQIFERAGIPGQLLVILEKRVMDPGLDNQEIAGVPPLWQIFPDLHYRTGADAWHFCDKLPARLCKEFDGLSWDRHTNLLSRFSNFSAQDGGKSFQIEGFLRNRSFEVQDAVIFWLQQCLLLLDPSTDACKSKEVLSVFDRLKEIEGKNWRAKAMARRLSALQSFIWEHCPLSADVVSALERISEMFFPSHIASNTGDSEENAASCQVTLLCSLSHPWFALPHWYSSSMPSHLKHYNSTYKLIGIHNYMRLYYIRNSAGNNIMDTSAIPAQLVGRMTTDPVTNYPMDPWRYWCRQVPMTSPLLSDYDSLVDYYSVPMYPTSDNK